MSDSNLTQFKTETGIELVINTQTGEAFATQAGYCRMSGKASSTISDRVNSLRDNSVKSAEIQTTQGLRMVRLIPAKTVFRWLMKDDTALAVEMGEVGATVFLHKLAGYQVTSNAIVVSAPEPPKQPVLFEAEVRFELEILQMTLGYAGLDPNLIAGVMLNHAGSRMPQLKAAVNAGHSLLAASCESDLLMTPTRIGKELGISARKVNLLLLELGYQVRNFHNSKTEPDYVPTEAGRRYASNTLATGRLTSGGADNSTYQHLKWKSTILDVLRPELAGFIN